MNLLLKDIGKLKFAKKPVQRAEMVVHFLTRHTHSRTLVRKHAANGSQLELVKPGLCTLLVLLVH
jgi:hypothetical protein